MLGGCTRSATGSGRARTALALEIELALDRYQAHARAVYGDAYGTAVTFWLVRHTRAPLPEWLVELFEEHSAYLLDLFGGARSHDPDRWLWRADPYARDAEPTEDAEDPDLAAAEE